MVSDRALQRLFGFRPQGVALWGTVIRAFTLVVAFPVLAALTGVYVNVVQNTIEIRQGQDFGVFFESALSVLPERGSTERRDPIERRGTLPSPNLNPPHFNVVLLPFTLLDLPQALLAWLATSAVALVLSLTVIVRTVVLRGWAVLAACAFLYAAVPMVSTLLTGQVGLVLLLPFTLAWASARRDRYLAAGAWIGVCASIKPFFLLFVPYLVMRRQRGAAAVSLVMVVALFSIGLAYYGVEAYRVWLTNLASVTWAEHYMNASVLGVVERSLSASEWRQVPVVDVPDVVMPLWAALCAGMGVATLWRVRDTTRVDGQFLLITTAALLLSPLGWTYYLWFLAPPIVATVSSLDRITWRECLLGMGLVGFLVPPFLPLGALGWSHGLGTATLGSVYFWSLAALWFVSLRLHDGGTTANLLLTLSEADARPDA